MVFHILLHPSADGIQIVFQKFSLSLKNYENFDANQFLEPTLTIQNSFSD